MWPFKKSAPKPEPATVVSQPSRELRPFSFVSPEVIRQIGGLPTEAIFGFMEGEGLNAAGLRPNPPFLNFLHDVIRRHVPASPAAQAGARRQHTGTLLIIDGRTRETPDGSVPERDIIGMFEVKDGVIAPERYIPNDRYLVFSTDGHIVLPPDLQRAFTFELMRLAAEGTLKVIPLASSNDSTGAPR